MPTPKLPDALVHQAAEAYRRLGSEGNELLDLGRSTYEKRVSIAIERGFLKRSERRTVSPLSPMPVIDDWGSRAAAEVKAPPPATHIDDLLARRKAEYKKKVAHEEASRLIPVTVKVPGPIGILHFGDPHVDDDGTDIQALEDHTDLCNRTPGLFAANVGDTTNNWTGRLARLYGEQGTTSEQAWLLAEWFIKRCKWLYMIGGNHDAWSGAGDPLKWIAHGQTYLYRPSEARMALHFPNRRVVRVNARHDHSGHSMWNPAHGAMKALQMGFRDHIAVAGHKHVSGYGVIKDPQDGITCHALLVGSYKVFDRYAKEKGFRDQQLSPCAVTVIDPSLPENAPDLVKVFWNPHEGADYLTFKRKRAGV